MIDLIMGNGCEAVYVDGVLVQAADKITLLDLLGSNKVPANIWNSDFEDPDAFPQTLKEFIDARSLPI